MSGEPFGPHLPRETWEAWLDDRLDGAARGRLEDHLAGCAECSDWIARTDASHLFHRLRAAMPEPAWEGFWEGIHGELAPRTRRRRPLVLAAGMAAGLALLALAGMIARGPDPRAVGGDVAQEGSDPCAQATLAVMNLSRPITVEECRRLHGSMAVDATPVMILGASVDLRGL